MRTKHYGECVQNTTTSGRVRMDAVILTRNFTLMLLPSLHHLSERLVNAAADITAPIPASQRIPDRTFVAALQSQWNSQIEALFRGAGELDRQVVEWGRKALYGGDVSRTKPE